MKAEVAVQISGKSIPGFSPFEITIRAESKEELQRLYFIFNYSPITSVIGIEACCDARAVIASRLGDDRDALFVRLRGQVEEAIRKLQ